jgi:hypothetical protein
MMALSKHWINHIGAWQRSGLSQAAYCRQHELNAKSFSGRLSEYRAQGISPLPALIPVQVKVDEQQLSLTHALVLTVQGCRLELPPTVSAQWLAELLRCLS